MNHYPFHGMYSDTAAHNARVTASLKTLEQREAQRARADRNARRAVFGIFALIGLAVAVRIAYWADLAALVAVI